MTQRRHRLYLALTQVIIVTLVVSVSLMLIWSVDWQIIASTAILLIGLGMAVSIAHVANEEDFR